MENQKRLDEKEKAALNRKIKPDELPADRLQHYDVDGVSFSDSEGVTVSSDEPEFPNIPSAEKVRINSELSQKAEIKEDQSEPLVRNPI
jgi:hypothetical protein